MQLELSETQALLKTSLREYLLREVSYDRVRELEVAGRADAALWEALAQNGWLGLPFPEVLGGAGAGLVEVAIAVEEIARRAAVIPFVETMIAALALLAHGEKDVVDAIVPGILAGRMTIAPAVLEQSDRYGDVSAAIDVDQGDDVGRLTGQKLFVDHGQTVTHHLVLARDADGPGLWLVDAQAPGVGRKPQYNIGRTPQVAVTYGSVTARRAGGPEAATLLERLGRALSSVQCLGYAQAALEMTVDYVKNRVQFGRPIGSFQAVQHHCADMATMVEGARFLVYEAVWKLGRGTATDEDLAVAKAFAARAGVFVTLQAHQLHGGIGVTEEYHLNFYSRRAKERSIAWGSESECLTALAATAAREEAWA